MIVDSLAEISSPRSMLFQKVTELINIFWITFLMVILQQQQKLKKLLIHLEMLKNMDL